MNDHVNGTMAGILNNVMPKENALPSVPSNALFAVSESAQRLLDAWDAKTPLAWQPENNRALLEDLRAALKTPNAEAHGRRSRTVQPLVGSLDSE